MEDLREEKILIEGMTCESCEKIIKKQALSIEGVKEIDIDYSSGKGHVKFYPSKVDIDKILDKIEEKGYTGCILSENINNETINSKPKSKIKWFYYATIIIGFFIIGYFLLQLTDKIALPQISANMGYGLLFLVGLLTGFKSSYSSHIAYGSGKLISYTVIGAAFGFIGSIITFTPLMRGFAGIIAGLFLILFGLNMLNIFPALRKIRIGMPSFLTKFIGHNTNSSPLVIGLLNGLMIACGPLQAIYIMAAGTGNLIEGAKLLFVFGLGTLPVMLSFGFLTSFISNKATHKILKASGAIVIILGLIMINRGLALTGTGLDTNSLIATVSAADNKVTGNTVSIDNGYQTINMDVLASGWSPSQFVLKKGVPVKWIINGKEITSCNNAIQVPKLGLKFDVKPGIQIIEFTPNEEGIIPFSCWMGMRRGNFIVKEDIDLTNKEVVQKELNSVPALKSGTCSMGSGCGCGG